MTTNKDFKKRQLHQFIKNGLKDIVEKDPRLIQPLMTEYTFQAIIWDHICRQVKNDWTLAIEDFIPGTQLKADVVIYKCKQDGKLDLRYGAVAIEVKPNGLFQGIKNDIKKLMKYTRHPESPVNFGVMIFMSRQDQSEDRVNDYIRKDEDHKKICIIRIKPPKKLLNYK